MQGHRVFVAFMTLGAVFLISGAGDAERHRTVNLVIVTIMFIGAALDLAIWTRHHRLRARAESLPPTA